MIPDSEAIELLQRYNNIVLNLIEASTTQIPLTEEAKSKDPGKLPAWAIDIYRWSVEYSQINSEVESLKSGNEDFFQPNNTLVTNSDLINEENVVNVLLYSAVTIQWPSLDSSKLFSVEERRVGKAYNKDMINTIKQNLEILSSQDSIYASINQEGNDEIKTLKRTLALYFYIRACGGSLTIDLFLLKSKTYKFYIDPIINKESNLENILRGLRQTKVIREVFRSFINEEDENEYDRKLGDFFDHVIGHSFYANLPEHLYGLTAIGHKLFISHFYSGKNDLKIGSTIIILLHEMAHLIARFWDQPSSYFITIPRDINGSSDLNCSIGERGNYVEALLFGGLVKKLYRRGALFVLDIDNWDLECDLFKDRFILKQEEGEEAGEAPTCLARGKGVVDSVSFDRCGMSYWISRE